MLDDWGAIVRSLPPAKALAVAAYWESVAAYRYRTLAEKATVEAQRKFLADMANEEQNHHIRIQELLQEHFPDADFVLTPEDKELIIVGPRMLEVPDAGAFNRALEVILESERRTAKFYQILQDVIPRTDLKRTLREMMDECLAHAKRLENMPVG